MAEQRLKDPSHTERGRRLKRILAIGVVLGVAATTACGVSLKPNDVTVPRDISISGFWDPGNCKNASPDPSAENHGFDEAFRKEIEALGYTSLTPMPDNDSGLAWKYEATATDPKHPSYGSPRVDVVANGNIVLPKTKPATCALLFDDYTAQGSGPLAITNARNQAMPTASEATDFFHQAVTQGMPDRATVIAQTIASGATQASVGPAA